MDTAPSRSAGSDTGPPALGPLFLFRDRSLRLAAGLAVAIAIPVAVLFYFQFRSVADLGQLSAVVLRQLSQHTADALTKDVDDWLKSPHIEGLVRITQAQTEPLNLPFIQNTFDNTLKKSSFIRRFYVWSDESVTRDGELLAYDRARPGFIVRPPETDALLAAVRRLALQKRIIVAFEIDSDGRRKYVQAQLRFTFPDRERLTSFSAFAVDAEDFRRDDFPAFLATRARMSQVPTGFPSLVVTVADHENRMIAPPDGSAAMPFVDERAFPLVFFDRELIDYVLPYDSAREQGAIPEMWTLRTGYGRQTIAEIVESRARPERAMMALLAAVMALGVFFVSRAAAREVRLAELKSNFVSSVSHDLKTPLALIQLFAETLELGRLKSTERAQEYYRIINSEARKLTRLINNLLDFSKMEAGLRRYKREPVDLAAVTTHVLASLENQFRQNQFTVTAQMAPTMTAVVAEPEAVEQALENLLSNAMKYSPEHREILVQVDAVPGFGRVRVTDRGIGIPPRLHRKIFRKFYRIQTDVGSGAQGTGLGLAIVDHVVRALGGYVQVDSVPGRGSTFTLHFPLYAGEVHVDEADSGDRGRAADVARSA